MQKNTELSALEFFSGIGAFRILAPSFGIKVVRAFDQSQLANQVYSFNFGEKPCSRNLDTIGGAELPDADLWWMSPPCKPVSRRGKRKDMQDHRAAPLLNLISLIPKKMPANIALENVLGFSGSDLERTFLNQLGRLGYKTEILKLCPCDLGIPMQRPRLFYLSTLKEFKAIENGSKPLQNLELSTFIDDKQHENKSLELCSSIESRFESSLNIIDPAHIQNPAICFTSAYGKSLRASGSMIRLPSGRLRYFHPSEILKLFGFPCDFQIPDELSLREKWRLCGNTIELRSLACALTMLGKPD